MKTKTPLSTQAKPSGSHDPFPRDEAGRGTCSLLYNMSYIFGKLVLCKDSLELSWNMLVHRVMRQIFVKARRLNCNLYLGLCHKDFVEIFLK